jgi:hypothetical protein
MRRFVLLFLLLSATLLPAGSALASGVPLDFGRPFKLLGTLDNVPAEWAGVWTTQDSIYDCTTGFMSSSSGADTLCTGQALTQSVPNSPIVFTCTGTSDATTYHLECNGSVEFFPDCQTVMQIVTDGTRTSESYRTVSTITTTYSGTATGCDLIPGSCLRIVAYGTRTGPAPADYCTTPAKRTTWGQLKVSYR